jgi:mannan endo-1,4-beta-mannosidase
MSLIGVNLLNNFFVQDPNPNWIKIDGVAIGESNKYGYTSINSNGDIGGLLNKLSQDPNVCCVVYNWSNYIGYVKTGFNLNVSSDYKLANGYTTFVLKSKIPSYYPTPNPTPNPTPTPTPNPTPIPTPIPNPTPNPNQQFITWNKSNSNFQLNGKKFVPVGVNCFGLGLCQEYMNYMSHQQISEIFNSVKKLNGTTIRSHTLGFSASSENSLLDNNLNFREAAWDPIDFSLTEAKRTGLKVIPILCDPYEYYHGSYRAFCTNGIPKEQFFTHPIPRNNFKKFISGWLNHTNKYTGIVNKNCSDIFALELGNELGEQRPDSGSTAIPTKEWLTDISNFIKSIAPNILILCPTDESLGQSDEFNIQNLDLYSQHFYWNDFNRMNLNYNNAKNVNKPYIIGEYSSQFGQDWFNYIEQLNIHGSFVWSLMPHESNGKRVPHDDSFTFWYDNQTPENTKQLLLLTNHFRRLQNLPTISQLSF